ncbi:MAG: M28 family peptidase, partial [Planctomycetota bacterium]
MRTLLILLAVLTTTLAASPETPGLSADITADEMSEHVKILASDEYEGRRSGQPGGEKAAKYIEQRFKEIGLDPIGDDGTYRQTFALPVREVVAIASHLTVRREKGETTFAAGATWKPFPATKSADLADLEVVFAGYGLKAKGWNDYAGIDVKGKAVLILRHCPNYDPDPRKNPRFLRAMSFPMKLRAAATAGAAAVIVVNDTIHHEEGSEPLDVPWMSRGMGAEPPFLFAKAEVAKALLAAAGRDFEALQQEIEEAEAPDSFELPDVRLDLSVRQSPVHSPNIVGLLPGSDRSLKEEIIIVGAHYDHLGTDGFGARDPNAKERLWNGADDNASGTAGLIELAEQFALTSPRPKRSLLFIAFTGEEMGVLGSRHYVAHPLIPNERCVLMLNMDMIGRLRDDKLFIGGVGTSPVFDDLITQANEGVGLKITRGRGGMTPSDNMVFFRKGLSTLFFNTGMHKDLHCVTDDWEKQNFEGSVKTLTVASRVLRLVGDLDERPTFVNARNGVLGVTIDQRDKGEGVLLSGVSPSLGAAKGGLLAGDRIVEL